MEEASLVQQILSAPVTKDIGLGAIVTLVIVSIIRGWLTPAAVVKQLIAAKDSIIASKDLTILQFSERLALLTTRGDEYKATVDKQMELITKLTDQNGELLDGSAAANHYFNELARITSAASNVGPRSGDGPQDPRGGSNVGTS
jgi:methyl-accepting chemotaxis protein